MSCGCVRCEIREAKIKVLEYLEMGWEVEDITTTLGYMYFFKNGAIWRKNYNVPYMDIIVYKEV
jgi:hypothetical protein